MENEEIKILFRRWFYASMSISCITVLIYGLLHYLKPGNEVKTLSSEQLSAVNSIILRIDSTKASKDASIKLKKDAIKNYLKVNLLVEFNNDTTATKNIDSLVDKNSLDHLIVILPTYPFEVKSFFWLKGALTYLELLFWVWFGVMSSVLYKAINVYNIGEFSGKLIWDHIAKLFYAPPVAIVLYLCSDLLSNSNLIKLDKITYGSIVFVFVIGFFSGRAIELLNRLKDVIIPLGTNTSEKKTVGNIDVNTVQNQQNASDAVDKAKVNLLGRIKTKQGQP
jgi:hypothetical protein